MTLLSSSLLMYLLIGIGVAGALFVSDAVSRPTERWFRVTTAVPFWPLYLPILLVGRRHSVVEPAAAAHDEMAGAISQVSAELEAALAPLDDETRDFLDHELERIHDLPNAWTVQAARVREMDRVLALPAVEEPLSPPSERVRHIQETRRQNVERLRALRQRSYDDLMGTLVWVRELVSMLHLAKFGGAPSSRVHEVIGQIAATADGAAPGPWRDDINTAITAQPTIQ